MSDHAVVSHFNIVAFHESPFRSGNVFFFFSRNMNCATRRDLSPAICLLPSGSMAVAAQSAFKIVVLMILYRE